MTHRAVIPTLNMGLDYFIGCPIYFCLLICIYFGKDLPMVLSPCWTIVQGLFSLVSQKEDTLVCSNPLLQALQPSSACFPVQ